MKHTNTRIIQTIVCRKKNDTKIWVNRKERKWRFLKETNLEKTINKTKPHTHKERQRTVHKIEEEENDSNWEVLISYWTVRT